MGINQTINYFNEMISMLLGDNDAVWVVPLKLITRKLKLPDEE